MPAFITASHRWALRISVITCVATTAACGTAHQVVNKTSSSTQSGSSATPSGPPYPAPAIVQVENSSEARPQSGLQSASVVYEYLAEGGITRLSAIFFPSPPIVNVGPVRSARLATIQITHLYGGVLAYSGASTYIQGQLSAAGVLHYDESAASGDLFRVTSAFAPHNLFTDGGHLADLLKHAAAPQVSYSLWPRTAPVTATPSPASTVSPQAIASPQPTASPLPAGRVTHQAVVPLSTSETPTYIWHPELPGYERTDPGTGVLGDHNTGKPLVVSTVVIQQVPVSVAPQVHDVNGVLGTNHVLTGTGNAQILTGGLEYDVTWAQPPSGPPQFRLPDGTAPPIAPGLVWICLVPTSSPAALS